VGCDSILGIWFSTRYGPGSMSDEAVAFLSDHRGFWRFTSAGGSRIEAFRWTLNSDGTLRISGAASYEVDCLSDGYRIVEAAGGLHFDELPFHIERENTPWDRMMEVLTLDSGRNLWRNSLLDTFGILSQKFGLRRRCIKESDIPRPMLLT